ncbi:MAG: GTP-binding protein TypA [Candidatus Andersenbacteria bacterium RIFCSPHIGHO2_02_FULL_45_11]|uniref:50S ribosomal subunit assembly factor BipA n=1 Tax=Candidatus Andersenbacteria bacterium RIFCSPHIGHO2_12_FULL_45_11 TaxID=1797281 RepID=A0A1G1X0Q5_9BACT|nr:MAG: GTP-binding protein TypA [Candidatus Andersenbacteria bacterium RIFCSPHIGHO2_01_FULL_46_36]OGY33140.1 MAG: GTP-binding protein TypA [Candidatus Andersenbacteria bacterium RIFCSPHIGHO2_12_FULL_45_11]OGY33164.1 MAG: GTP-binding protein TypA [Candidatus Andersenbacteria bacterium RIFCSPHIGHO2_02_FULL_45_11]
MSVQIRNVAIIAHVDHGKTTLVDALLKQSEAFSIKDQGGNLIMDSNELERERGITIFSKNASVKYKSHKINIIDTPGHADFGGEVERIMSMVNGVLLLVDAKDGPMPQTKFVLKKALEAGHTVIVVINKIDVPEARVQWVLDQTFGLFVDLGATDEQADFPVLYASAINGKAGTEADLSAMADITPVFDAIIEHVPAPAVSDAPTQMHVVNVVYDSYKGQIAIGPLKSGSIKKLQKVMRIMANGEMVPSVLSSIMTFDGLSRAEVTEVSAGDIVAIAGIEGIKIGETIADFEHPVALPTIHIDEPTVKMSFSVNTSPFAGTEGEFSTARHIKARLERELLSDVALKLEYAQGSDSMFTVFGRGELHLSILIEKMLREGYEFQVGKPQVILIEKDGKKEEPFEDVYIECPEVATGSVIEKLSKRKGEMKDMRVERGIAHMHFLLSTRGFIGYRSEFLTDTKGEGIINSIFHGYLPYIGEISLGHHGSLIAHETGVSTTYGLVGAQGRGKLFIGPQVKVYEGMIVGQHSRAEDLEVNICKEKQLTNMRSAGEGVSEHFNVPVQMSLEECIEYLGDDELLEVTPTSLRLRKMFLKKSERKRANVKK